MSEYASRDTIEQGEVYAKHIEAMTAEGLWGKWEIAAELAHRDIQIARLQKGWEEEQLKRAAVINDCKRLRDLLRGLYDVLTIPAADHSVSLATVLNAVDAELGGQDGQ